MVIECSICTNLLDDDEFKPVSGTCGHTICIKCCRAIANKKCPTCQREYAFLDETVNFQLIDLINSVKDKEAKQVQKEKAEEEKLKRNFRKCCECGSLIKKEQSRICLPCCETLEIFASDGKTPLNEQLAESFVFCGSCSLEGVHKEHKTVLYDKFKLKQQAVIALGKVVGECKTVTGCSERFQKMVFVNDSLLKGLKGVTGNVQTMELTECSSLLSVCENAKNEYNCAISKLEDQIETTTKIIQRIEAQLMSKLPAKVENKTLLNKSVHETTRKWSRASLLLPLQRLPIPLPSKLLIQQLKKLAQPIAEIMMQLVNNHMRGIVLKFEKLPTSGIFCCAANCRNYCPAGREIIGNLCESNIRLKEKEGWYPYCEELKAYPLFNSDGTCQKCNCQWTHHIHRSYIITRFFSNIKKEQSTQRELNHLKNFLVEAILFRASWDPLRHLDQDPFKASLRFFVLAVEKFPVLYPNVASSLKTLDGDIMKIVENKQIEIQQGLYRPSTQLQMEQMIEDLGQLEITGPVLVNLDLLNFGKST